MGLWPRVWRRMGLGQCVTAHRERDEGWAPWCLCCVAVYLAYCVCAMSGAWCVVRTAGLKDGVVCMCVYVYVGTQL